MTRRLVELGDQLGVPERVSSLAQVKERQHEGATSVEATMAGPDTATADELEQLGRAIVDANLYMVLGTADGAGRPWVSPVYCVPDAYRELIWVSSPEARHSRNLWTLADVEAPARLRLYRATAVEQFVLDEHDRRVSVTL